MTKFTGNRRFSRFIFIFLLMIPGMFLFGQAPTAVTGTATGVGSSDAILNGTVNANGASTTVYFEYGTSTAYGSTAAAVQSPVTGSTDTAVTATPGELLPDTTYHFRVVATNANGTTNGADMTFTTLSNPPLVLTAPATGIGTDSATLNGIVNPQNADTTVTFEYGTDTSYGTTVTADQSPLTTGLDSAQPVTKNITGLANNTTYHYRVVAQNAGGTTYGNDMTFTTGTVGTAPTATTNAATGIGGTTATLNGTVNAGDAETIVMFEYGTDTSYGSFATAVQNPVSGGTDTAVSAFINDLTYNTTYHYRVVATNTNGTANGADMTFTTLPNKPGAVTIPASAVTTSGATLNGTVNANDSSTTVTFQYGVDTSYGTTVTADQNPVTGSTDTAVSKAITGLANGITYHYRVAATNAGGTTYGADMTFTTGTSAPTATTNAASGLGPTSVTLNGTVNANNATTTVTFQYGLDTNYDRSVAANPGSVSGSTNTAVNVTITDLFPNTLYHYRVMAVNVNGTTYGADMTFTTLAAPTVTTNAAAGVTTSGATLNGTVNANNFSATVTFEYGLTTSYGTTVTADQSPVTGSGATAVSKAITGLTANTVYHYRVVGQNANGITYGADMTFITTVSAPVVITNLATSITFNQATLRGTVTANNSSTTVTFEYGTTIAYGTTVTADQSPVTGVNEAVSKVITGLANNQTYHYRVVGQNANGTVYGADMTFTTSILPSAVTQPASGVGGGFATLNGIVNANFSPANVSFEYGPTIAYGTTVTADQSPVDPGSETPVSKTITGLSGNTLYHYRVVAQNAQGTSYGADMIFTTVTSPTAVTDAATDVGTNSATLKGTVNANNASTTVTFEYGDSIGYHYAIPAVQNPVLGSTDTAVSGSVGSLYPNTTYHYRVVAQNVNDTVYGADMTFTTGPSPPTADTNAASGVTSTGATLNGTVNANNDSTTVTFQYGPTISYGSTITADQSPVTGVANTTVSKAITGLSNNTTCHYRVVAQNSSGTTYGADMTFFTGTAPPIVTTGTASDLGATGATLNGTVNANNSSTTVTFEYGETTGYGRVATADQSPVTGSTDTAVSVNVIDLVPNTTYHFRAVGQNASGTGYGTDITFTTNVANSPIVTTANVTDITAVSALSGGNVTDEGGAPVTARGVCWSTFPGPTIADNLTSDGTGVGTFTSALTGLSASSIYYVRAYATNLYGTAYGEEIQFTTNSLNTPTVNTVNVTQITAESAKSGGNVTDEGDFPVTARGVCWSTAPNPTIANNKTSNGTGLGAFTSYLTNLTVNTTYYVRAYATNSAGTAYGGQFQFTSKSAVVNVTITEPGDGDIVSGTVTIAAFASVGMTSSSAFGHIKTLSITRVKFYIDNSLIGTVTSPPYEIQWDSTTVADGIHIIKAVAYDQNDNSSRDEISVTVSNGPVGPGEIILNRSNLNFGSIFQGNSTAGSTMGNSVTTGKQTLLINYTGAGTLEWSITKDAEWLTCSPVSGKGPGVVKVSVNPSGMAVGTYSASITVSDLNTSDGVVLPVNLTVYKQGTTSAPFGYFETPIDNSTVMSSIPVTGWVLDDIEVTRVKIYRAAVPGEGSGMVYIGDAVFVDGARPDVETMYPYYPLNYQAGWGYMLLTNFLPNQGNGTYTLYARAVDAEGKSYTLGTKTIICDNASAVKPFGAIDTPGQGGVASGKSYTNFGWALTPLPNTIPIDGSTILVWVDGVPLGNPVYNKFRSDIASLFPGYNNSDGAGGHFYLDTTQYINGVHTISWSVKDNAGNIDGIGSRYFSIRNAGSSKSLETTSVITGNDMIRNTYLLPSEIFRLTKEFDHNPRSPGSMAIEGRESSLTIKELEYVILRVSENQPVVRGYLAVNERLNPLPIGSTLDTGNGIFYWHPGPGFLGRFKLVFVIKSPTGQFYNKSIAITIEPK